MIKIIPPENPTSDNYRRDTLCLADVFQRIRIQQDKICELSCFNSNEIFGAVNNNGGIQGCCL
jgi:hypothetical protein